MDKNLIGEMVEYYLSGNSLRACGSKYNTDHRNIRETLLLLGIQPRGKKEAALPQVRFNTCVVCSKRFRPKLHWTDTNSHNRKTCSDECFSIFISDLQKGNKGNNWKGGGSQTYYQKVRRELKQDVCEICGTNDGRMDTHHIDRDHTNNTLENIQVLCIKCHAKRHYIEDDRGLRGWKGDGN